MTDSVKPPRKTARPRTRPTVRATAVRRRTAKPGVATPAEMPVVAEVPVVAPPPPPPSYPPPPPPPAPARGSVAPTVAVAVGGGIALYVVTAVVVGILLLFGAFYLFKWALGEFFEAIWHAIVQAFTFK